jgi:transcriptional regulator with XRE-family HTH domain
VAGRSNAAVKAEKQLALGRALRGLRERAGLTQEQLAHRIEMSFQYVSDVENGHRGLRWETVERFLVGLNATLHELADELDTARHR